MPSITAKNIPEPIYNKLKQQAESQHRSMNSEIIACLERSVEPKRVSPDEILRQARVMRKKLIDLPEAIQLSEKAENQMLEREFHVNPVQVYNLAEKSDCSSYDCEFISLAEGLDVKLITMDKQILRSFPERSAKPLDIIDL